MKVTALHKAVVFPRQNHFNIHFYEMIDSIIEHYPQELNFRDVAG